MPLDDAVIIGYGVVGRATSYALGIDKYFDLNGNNIIWEEAARRKFIFICLPTPTVNGVCFTKDIEEVVKKIAQSYTGRSILILRSTLIPGTTRRLSQKYKVPILHHPEFLTEATAKKEAKNPDILVFGGDDKKIIKRVLTLYKEFNCPKFTMDSVTSETLKYAINTFYATKVVFANQIYDICQKVGADYDALKKTMYARKWIGENHLDVWHKGYRGVGGNCLPKDLEAFVSCSRAPLLTHVFEFNKKLIRKNYKQQKNASGN